MIGLSNLSHELKRIGEFSSEVDVLQARAYIAEKYNYCSPVVVKTAEHAFFDAKGLRHPLIEHLSERELYVTNDMALGQEKRGMLLYGTNAVGKTSLIRAVGIAIVMAQAGLHVPCESLEFSPYHAVYTRILGTDNIFKGLSTFAVEMAELRAILKGADKNSLILGDELCSGTESGSAIGIFAAGLESLHDRESTFLFATHLHEVNQFSEVKKLDGLSIKHLQVLYDAERDVLIYDRKLKDGPGEAKYGLEVCKSLGLPEAFLERAHGLRKKYSSSGESVLDKPSSRYNAKKVRGMCQSCKQSPATQVHHLQHQARARSDNAYIGTFHKDHTANLLSVCDECHHKFHEEDVEHRFAKTSEGYQLIPE
jgi:DNA mismatch repair protein MutS